MTIVGNQTIGCLPGSDDVIAHVRRGGELAVGQGAQAESESVGHVHAVTSSARFFPEDVYAWLRETQSEAWAKVVKPTMSPAEQEKAKAQLLDRLVKTLDQPLDAGGGTLNVLSKGSRRLRHGSRCASSSPRPRSVRGAGMVRRGAGASDAAGLRACQGFCVSRWHGWLVDVTGEPVCVGDHELVEGLFPAVDDLAFDEVSGGFSFL